MERHIQADNAFIKWMVAMSKNVVHIADAWYDDNIIAAALGQVAKEYGYEEE